MAGSALSGIRQAASVSQGGTRSLAYRIPADPGILRGMPGKGRPRLPCADDVGRMSTIRDRFRLAATQPPRVANRAVTRAARSRGASWTGIIQSREPGEFLCVFDGVLELARAPPGGREQIIMNHAPVVADEIERPVTGTRRPAAQAIASATPARKVAVCWGIRRRLRGKHLRDSN